MVSTFTREIIINADLILLSPTLFKSINNSNYSEFDDFITEVDSSNEYVIQLIYNSLFKFVFVDLFTFIIAGCDVLNWNHRQIILDKFYRQIFYPITIKDYHTLEEVINKDAINVCYSLLICGTKMLVSNEVKMIEMAIDKFNRLMYSIDLKTQYVTFSYEYKFEDEINKSSEQLWKKLIPEISTDKLNVEFTKCNESEHIRIDNKLTKRLSKIIIPFLLVPELDNVIGIYHRAPRILIYGDDNRKVFDTWLNSLKQHLKFKHIPISIPHIFSCYCGDSERNLTFAFDLAKSHTSFPIILVLYGIHLICAVSDDKSDLRDRLLTTLLLQLDQLNQPLQSNYTHAHNLDINCSNDCPIIKWINQCNKHDFPVDIDIKEINKASQIAVIAFTDIAIDELCQSVTRKGRFDFLIE